MNKIMDLKVNSPHSLHKEQASRIYEGEITMITALDSVRWGQDQSTLQDNLHILGWPHALRSLGERRLFGEKYYK
jgi:hypothetical protein